MISHRLQTTTTVKQKCDYEQHFSLQSDFELAFTAKIFFVCVFRKSTQNNLSVQYRFSSAAAFISLQYIHLLNSDINIKGSDIVLSYYDK